MVRPSGADVADRGAWRAASPHWGPDRERLLEAKAARALGGQSVDPDEDDPVEAFRSQFLNIWPVRRIVPGNRAELLVDRDTWAQPRTFFAPVPDGPVMVAVEDFYGLGAAAAAAVNLPDGRTLVWGDVFDTRAEAYSWAAFTGTPGGVPGPDRRVHIRGRAAEVVGLPGWRMRHRAHLCGPAPGPVPGPGREVVPLGDGALSTQATTVRVVATTSGGLTPAHKGVRSDLLRAMAWAVHAAAERAAQPSSFSSTERPRHGHPRTARRLVRTVGPPDPAAPRARRPPVGRMEHHPPDPRPMGIPHRWPLPGRGVPATEAEAMGLPPFGRGVALLANAVAGTDWHAVRWDAGLGVSVRLPDQPAVPPTRTPRPPRGTTGGRRSRT